MKRFVLIALPLLLVIGLVACSVSEKMEKEPFEAKTVESVEYSYEIQDPALLRTQDRYEFFIETEDYYYYLYENKVYFSTKDDPTFYLLCGKPDCSHSGVDCNAYAGLTLGWWNEKLYGVVMPPNSDMYLFSMNEDGSEHTAITDIILPLNTDGSYGGSYFFFFHDGYLYYYVLATPNALFRADLATGETTRLMEEELNDGAAIFEKWLYEGDSIYMILRDVSQECYLYRLCGEDAEKVCDWEFGSVRWNIKGDTVLLYSAEYQAFCEYDLSTGTLTKKRDFAATHGAAYYDKEYIYLVTWDDNKDGRSVHFFDWDYQLLDEIELNSMQSLLYAAGDKFFFSGMPSYPITYYIPKSAIGTGELELIEVTNPYSYR